MRAILTVLPFVALTFLCWGNYGPLMHQGQHEMHHSSLRPFMCVGLAYFLIAVLVPMFVLKTRGEKGSWTPSGTKWSLSAGAAGAVGALGIIMAFKFRGSPVYVMPLVFGLAPVVNTLVTMWMAKTYKDIEPAFLLGVVMVAVGAAGVLSYKPKANKSVDVVEEANGAILIEVTFLSLDEKIAYTFDDKAHLEAMPAWHGYYEAWQKKKKAETNLPMVLLSVGLTALCWGSYGPVLHKGQMKMAGSRLRPFLCVGLSYFAIAVVVPWVVLQVWAEPGEANLPGVMWSLGAGAAGAVGALGIILAFNFGGKPIYVMPMVFGFAPVVNTFTTMLSQGTMRLVSPMFVLTLMLVIAGAVTVLTFAPKPAPKPQIAKPGNAA